MEASPSHEKLLRLKIASEMVLGSQAAVAFSRAFYLENLLIERILHEMFLTEIKRLDYFVNFALFCGFVFDSWVPKFQELFESCQALQARVKIFTEEVLDSSSSSDLSPITESSIRCQCSEILGSLEAKHQPTLETFQQKLIQAKARRQAKSSLLETLSAQSNNLSSQFNTMTLNELINGLHTPEFSCFINDSDFGVLEKLVEEWDQYRATAKGEIASHEKKIREFQENIEGNKRMREYTCDRILSQITQKQLGDCGTDTLKKKGVFHKFSTLLRRHSHSHHHRSSSVSVSMAKDASPSPSQLSIAAAESQNNGPYQQTF